MASVMDVGRATCKLVHTSSLSPLMKHPVDELGPSLQHNSVIAQIAVGTPEQFQFAVACSVNQNDLRTLMLVLTEYEVHPSVPPMN